MSKYIKAERYTTEDGTERVRGFAVVSTWDDRGLTKGTDGDVTKDDTIRDDINRPIGRVVERNGDTATVEVL